MQLYYVEKMASKSRNPLRIPRRKCNASQDFYNVQFSNIGGLDNHIKMLKDIVIVPLLHSHLYKYFQIKPPRGVIFYGPPGTGKTLVAGALATEVGKQSKIKVSFYNRKGADILDKWVGESERKLRELFELARKTQPSIIFFDELDGLAPERSIRNDQVHASIVTTLLALMDGLGSASSVIVIGATNRIECVDSALRRPGRFDRELYFPLPNSQARKEIFQVHTDSWKHKPTQECLDRLVTATSGCCGSDLQAICAEAVMCGVKRNYPDIDTDTTCKIDLESLVISDEDFTNAQQKIGSSAERTGGCRLRKLTPFIKPLLQRQVDKVIGHLEIALPHFLDNNKKYVSGFGNRYAGRLLIKGESDQGLNTYIIPALLHKLEHLNTNILDLPENYSRVISNAFQSIPSIMVLSRVDEWWTSVDNSTKMGIISMLENIYADLPMLLIVTFNTTLPPDLPQHFFSNCNVYVEIENPTIEERRTFFTPLFFGKTCASLWKLIHGGVPSDTKRVISENEDVTLPKICSESTRITSYSQKRLRPIVKRKPSQKKPKCGAIANVPSRPQGRRRATNYLAILMKSMVNRSQILSNHCIAPLKTIKMALEESCELINLKKVAKVGTAQNDELKIYTLWKRTVCHVTDGFSVAKLELLYDTLLACIFINSQSFEEAYSKIDSALTSFQNF